MERAQPKTDDIVTVRIKSIQERETEFKKQLATGTRRFSHIEFGWVTCIDEKTFFTDQPDSAEFIDIVTDDGDEISVRISELS
jgi:hypothetical protein